MHEGGGGEKGGRTRGVTMVMSSRLWLINVAMVLEDHFDYNYKENVAIDHCFMNVENLMKT